MSLLTTLNSLVSSSCLLCNGYVRGLKPLCNGCENELPWNSHACLRCAIPLHDAGHVCGQCLQEPPVFQNALCAFRYEQPVAGLLNRFKHNGKLACGHWLAHSLAEAIAAHYQEKKILLPDCIMPVPLHWKRLRHRGFDQGLEISKVLARKLALPLSNTLYRQRATNSQQGLDRTQRQSNLAAAFALRKPLSDCSSVALVDDVLTTGSTASEIAALLHHEGVRVVHIWAIARTP